MPRSARTTVSLPTEQYKELVEIAKDQHVSTSWVLREAVREYLARRYPLLQETEMGARDMTGIGQSFKNKES